MEHYFSELDTSLEPDGFRQCSAVVNITGTEELRPFNFNCSCVVGVLMFPKSFRRKKIVYFGFPLDM